MSPDSNFLFKQDNDLKKSLKSTIAPENLPFYWTIFKGNLTIFIPLYKNDSVVFHFISGGQLWELGLPPFMPVKIQNYRNPSKAS